MSTGNIIAIIAAAGAVAAVVVGWKQTNRTLAENRRLADLAAVRAVLDEAAVALHEASYGIAQVDLLKWRTADLGPALNLLEPAGKKLDALLERLKIRLGPPHPLVAYFEQSNEAALEVLRAGRRVVWRQPVTDNPTQAVMVEKWRDDDRGIVEHGKERFEAERSRFIESAYYIAGAQLTD